MRVRAHHRGAVNLAVEDASCQCRPEFGAAARMKLPDQTHVVLRREALTERYRGRYGSVRRSGSSFCLEPIVATHSAPKRCLSSQKVMLKVNRTDSGSTGLKWAS